MSALPPAFAASMEKGMNVALWAQLQPQAPAVVATTGNRTYCELNERCNQLVRALREEVGAVAAGMSEAYERPGTA